MCVMCTGFYYAYQGLGQALKYEPGKEMCFAMLTCPSTVDSVTLGNTKC